MPAGIGRGKRKHSQVEDNMLIKIKKLRGGEKVGQVDAKTLDEVGDSFKLGFLKLEHSSGPILIPVANIDEITRAQ